MDQSLPSSLAERCRWIVSPDQTLHSPGEFVLYWMHNAMRVAENPALTVASTLAEQNGLPLLVYHGLSEKYPYASDRHHAFIMQGVRDVQYQMQEIGITYAFHLERRGYRGPHLRDLTRRAAVLVTEEMPVAPLCEWLERLTHITNTPVLTVDAHNLIPWRRLLSLAGLDQSDPNDREPLGDLVSNAAKYRECTGDEYELRVQSQVPSTWSRSLAGAASLDASEIDLGFEPIDLSDRCLASLIGQCEIDHSIAPVCDTPGGTRAALARWEEYLANGLGFYATCRDDPTDLRGCSRQSAYLHYGMISPFQVAREAAVASAIRFMDEFLIWREMSFHYCSCHLDELDTLRVIPGWAQETLTRHISDVRQQTHSWEQLARGLTNHDLWNMSQQSLLRHGELHNNLRLTWGKAFLPLTERPDKALSLCIDLNHRYALDGRSPSSYGGIHWCFGAFDQSVEPEQKVFGKVRPRSIQTHSDQIDLPRLRQRCDRDIAQKLPSVAIVGAGMAGLMAARVLADHGVRPTIFEKSQGVGGRFSTRRVSDKLSFDHGAQYFTVRSDLIGRYVRSWQEVGVVQPWRGRIVELSLDTSMIEKQDRTTRYVGAPNMNALAKHLADGLNIVRSVRVGEICGDDGCWCLQDLDGRALGEFETVLVNAPPPQAADVLGKYAEFNDELSRVDMRPCWAVMVCCDALKELPFDGAFINQGPLSWIARNDSKPKRASADGASWVLHANSDWSQEHLEEEPSQISRLLLEALEAMTGCRLGEVSHCSAHRWRYAKPARSLDDRCLWDPVAQLGACGDWCGGPRVEGALLSGVALAGAVLRHYTIDRQPADASMGVH